MTGRCLILSYMGWKQDSFFDFFEISNVDSMSAYSGRLSGRPVIMTLFFLFHHTIPADSSPLFPPGYLFDLRLPMEESDIKYSYRVFRIPC
jgi:hypothetical protein